MAGLTGFLFLASSAAWLTKDEVQGDTHQHSQTEFSHLATAVYMANGSVVVELEDGCQKILEPKEGMVLTKPVLSIEGQHIAVTVQEASKCKTVTISVADGTRQEYDYCSTET